MNVLEKIFEEIEEARETYSKNRDMRFVVGADKMANKVKEIIVSHMDDCKIFEFDFTSVKSFDCQCGRHYVNTYNNGWIPVEERLPEEGKEVIAQFVVRVIHINGTVDEEVYIHPLYYENGVWKSFAGVPNGRVEAWQPLPEAYHPKQAPAAEHIMSRFTRAE